VDNVFSFSNLLKAYYQCRKRKRKTVNAAKFELNFESELLKLEQELKNHAYRPGRSICFVITDPKPREIFAADFRDRVIHHLLVNYLELIWEKIFIHHSYSCRQNKGAHHAIKDLKRFSKQVSDNFSKPAYYLQIDISAFFMSLKKDILFNIIKRHTKHPDILWLTKQIIFQDPTQNFYYKGDPKLCQLILPHKSLFHVPKNQGLPIGNLTSQFFANIYLNKIDQFAKHQLKIKYYLRYVDDILILSQNIKQLTEWKKKIDDFLQNNLKLKLHPKKQVLQSIYKGTNFVGFIIKPGHTFIRRRIVKKLKCKLYYFNKKILNFDMEHPIRSWTPELCNDFKEIFAAVNSYYGQFKHANTFKLRKYLYEKHFGILKIYLIPVNKDYNYFIWDEGF
jgi:RNA-directed DNA polymerase